MRLVFYSGGQEKSNHRLHRELASFALARSRHPRFTYIPFCSENSKPYFSRAVRRYRAFGLKDFVCLPVDGTVDKKALRRALSGHVIYLAGGNTFYFLHHLKQSGLMPKLTQFVKKGGVLAGLSAGGLIMTPHIELASYPSFEADENAVGLKNWKALGLVNFEFFPHYRKWKKLDQALLKYSGRSGRPIYACEDGCGFVVDGASFRTIGNVTVFHLGKKLQLGK